MKAIFHALVLAAAAGSHAAAADLNFEVERLPFGSGTPANGAAVGTEPALHVMDGLYHVPNHLPGHPTAAVIWPREVPVECGPASVLADAVCSGYRVHPAVGRGEYLFVRPVAKVLPPPPQEVVPEPAQPQEPPPVTRKKPLG
ncbi:hypothetical protein RY831_21000 [Noviherbaspirillum sp. CPCC 100848]|uniref:Uncharacterized protein n=1 Tax=Noviherbaspirillum album TaxID=3080276 RepID=A0ABU6JDP8_9BURK|nr:hypothetical protein [Noviherbaspirillum sp. CPCC 100848]MEC4721650.1 hypothetical protein [Noviherbaspirillum sp. CPCC 100848]